MRERATHAMRVGLNQTLCGRPLHSVAAAFDGSASITCVACIEQSRNQLDRVCPDGGRCHHDCAIDACFRVASAGPLSGVYPDNVWPDRIAYAFDRTRYRPKGST